LPPGRESWTRTGNPSVVEYLPYDGFPKPSLQRLNKPNGLYQEFIQCEI
jgi:hypothetical protein